jgi:hypothetical protein
MGMARGDLPFTPRHSGVGTGADLGLGPGILRHAVPKASKPIEGHPDEWADHPSGSRVGMGDGRSDPTGTVNVPCGPFRTGMWQEYGIRPECGLIIHRVRPTKTWPSLPDWPSSADRQRRRKHHIQKRRMPRRSGPRQRDCRGGPGASGSGVLRAIGVRTRWLHIFMLASGID